MDIQLLVYKNADEGKIWAKIFAKIKWDSWYAQDSDLAGSFLNKILINYCSLTSLHNEPKRAGH